MTVDDVARAESDTTIARYVKQGALGMSLHIRGPVLAEKQEIRLLTCRRLCQLRRRLREEGDGSESVARSASRYGFRQMGTIAADYRTLSGELPFETRRAAGELQLLPVLSRVVPLSPQGLTRTIDVECALVRQRPTLAADPSGVRRGGTADARTVW